MSEMVVLLMETPYYYIGYSGTVMSGILKSL